MAVPDGSAAGSRAPANSAIEVVQAVASASSKELREMREEHRLSFYFKSELEALENKLSRQMASSMRQLQSQYDLIVEAFLNPLETKVNVLEGRERKLDCQMSDVRGEVKGLLDEVQLQIRRSDKVEAKIRSWRKTSEESLAMSFERLRQEQETMAKQLVDEAKQAESRNDLIARVAKNSREIAILKEESRQDDILAAVKRYCDAMFDERLDQLTSIQLSRLEQEPKRDDILAVVKRHCDTMLEERLKQVSKQDDILPDVKRYCDVLLDERLEQVKHASAFTKPVDAGALVVSDPASRLIGSKYEDLEERVKKLELEVESWRVRVPVGFAAEQSAIGLVSVTPRPQVPRLDLSAAQNVFTPDSHPLPWVDSASPDPSNLTQSDVAAIASAVQEKVWRQCKDHFERIVQAQASEVTVIEELRADSIRAYRLIDELLSIVNAGDYAGGEDADVDALDTRSVAQEPSCAQLAQMMKFEISKLWQVLLRFLDHVELTAIRKDGNDTSENAVSVAAVRASLEEDGSAIASQERVFVPALPPQRNYQVAPRVEDSEGQPESAHPAAETALLQPSSRVRIEDNGDSSILASMAQPSLLTKVDLQDSSAKNIFVEQTRVQPYAVTSIDVKDENVECLHAVSDCDAEDSTKDSLEEAFDILRKSNEAINFDVDCYVEQSKQIRKLFALSCAMQYASEEQSVAPRFPTTAYASSVPQAVDAVSTYERIPQT